MVEGFTYTQQQVILASMRGFNVINTPINFDARLEGESRLMTNPFDFAYRSSFLLFTLYSINSPMKLYGRLSLTSISILIFLAIHSFLSYLHYGEVSGFLVLLAIGCGILAALSAMLAIILHIIRMSNPPHGKLPIVAKTKA